jgi:hypothetical protein
MADKRPTNAEVMARYEAMVTEVAAARALYLTLFRASVDEIAVKAHESDALGAAMKDIATADSSMREVGIFAEELAQCGR